MVVLCYVDFGYIFENGCVVMEGVVSELVDNEDVKEFYLGVFGGGCKNFCDMKFYCCCKCWLV